MISIYEYFTTPTTFVHMAVLCYILGFLTRKEFVLRLFILAGSLFFILYFLYISTSPMWEAIGASALIAAANLPVIFRILRERSTFGMNEEMLTLYKSFPNLNPGQFRKIMLYADIVKQTHNTVLLEQGKQPKYLYLTITDGFELERDAQNAEIGPGNFLGEISFLLGGNATATVIAKPGSSYVIWDAGKLQYMMDNSPSMTSAISVLLNNDIARKLAVSFPTTRTNLPKDMT